MIYSVIFAKIPILSDSTNTSPTIFPLLLLLRAGVDFVNSNTNSGWIKLPDGRKNLPDYAERAVLEAIVNHLIHRDYTVIGGEVHIDIFDDRIEFNSPGGMFDGTLIQNRDISKVPSVRRNPILADVFTHLEYMEKRGSGLRKICDLSARLDGYKEELHPEFTSEANVFYTTIKNVNYPPNDGKWVVKVGSSDAKVGSSADKVDSSFPENHHPVDIYGQSKRLSREVLSENIMQFCSEWRTPDDISVYTGKDLRYIKEKVLSSLVKSGLLERLYPDTPNHPKQKYRATR